KQIPMYTKRLKVKPGVTGLAQVTVGYDETLEDVKEKIRRDIEYIEEADSIKMNLKILWKTIFVVLLGEGQ
ncbi:MAG TPA: sugar transferase, partial [Caldithrix abyssi]|nr:sugar transferase [Caldithrix abyssi]